MQIYSFNNELYNNLSEAFYRPNGILAISVFFKIGNATNKDLLGVVAAAEQTIFKGETFQLKGLELRSLLTSTHEFMTYEGSLPFPPCHETVTWIILNHPIMITETEHYKQRWIVDSSGIQDACFVLFGTRQLDVPASELMFTLGLELSTVRFKRHRLKTLRRLRVADTLWSGSMADNFRPTQAINNRSVRTNINFRSSVRM
ncbi:unnamed protein product [Schistosoma margrebowiei]|uniref:Alpha-carbonic anhydrase domain-containing protein n=1 Tax=Schistosoma margrebowiei TaxID=48269 RepID=A0A3P8GBB5_9TREM|nr:unnamed protein product [Schistosoma margrebowiei]